MSTELDAAVMAVLRASDLELPEHARTLQEYIRAQSNDLAMALQVMLDELPLEHIDDITSRWQYAQVQASMWQLVAYVQGQPINLDYVQSTFTGARRRALVLADFVADLFPVDVARPMPIADVLEKMYPPRQE